MIFNEARGSLGPEEQRLIDYLMKNFYNSDTLNQIDRVLVLRKKLLQYHIHPN